jgi:hypothetical protein
VIRVRDFRESPSSEPEPVLGLTRDELMRAAGVRTDDGLKAEVERLLRHGVLVPGKDRPTRWLTPRGGKRQRCYALRGSGELSDVAGLLKRLRYDDREAGRAPKVSVLSVEW